VAQEGEVPWVTDFDAGLARDDNVARARDGERSLSDNIFSLNLRRREILPAGAHTRWIATLFAGGEVFAEYTKLSRAFGGAKLEFQYRASGEFDVPTYSLFAQLAGEQYGSALRRGQRGAVGVSMLKPVTDRIALFGALAHAQRNAKSKVFDGAETSVRANLDYALSRHATVYLGGEYREGDVVTSGPASLANVNIAKWLAPDDAFAEDQYFAYRFDGSTAILTLGYNVATETHSAFDFAFRQVLTRAEATPGFAGAGRARYEVRQFFVSYLKSF